jgi:hypothetical protein
MPSASFSKFHTFVEALAEKAHNLGADQLVVALTNTAPTPGTDDELADITQITYTFCSSRNVTTTSSAQTSGTYKLTLQDLVLTATGGSVGPFRYVVLYNDTSVNDKLIGYYDYGTNVTLNDGETFTINFDDAGGALTIA